MSGVSVAGPRWQVAVADHVRSLAWSSDGARLLVVPATGAIAIHHGADGSVVRTWEGHRDGSCSGAWSPTGELLATAGQDGRAWIRDTAGDSDVAIEVGRGWSEHVAWSPDGRLVAIANGRLARVYTLTGTLLADCGPHPVTVAAMAWSSRGWLATAAYGGVWLWRPEMGEQRSYAWKGAPIGLAWSADGSHLAAAMQDSAVHVWRIADHRDWDLHGFPDKVRALAWEPKRTILITPGGADLAVWRFDGSDPNGQPPVVLAQHEAPVMALAVSGTPQLFATGDRAGQVVRWRNGRAEVLATFADSISAMAWNVHHGSLAVGTADGTVAVFA